MSDEQAIVVGVVLLLMVVVLSAGLYTAHKDLQEIEANLQRSRPLLQSLAPFQSGGLLGKSIMCGVISFVFLVPRIFKKKGYIDLEEVQRFPRGLKLRIIIPWYSLYVLWVIVLGDSYIRHYF